MIVETITFIEMLVVLPLRVPGRWLMWIAALAAFYDHYFVLVGLLHAGIRDWNRFGSDEMILFDGLINMEGLNMLFRLWSFIVRFINDKLYNFK
jgi:hypothetical protein